MARNVEKPAKKKRGCWSRILGCAGMVLALFVLIILALIVLPGRHAKSIQRRIEPGMTLLETVEKAEGWLSCTAYAGPANNRSGKIQVWPKQFSSPGMDTPQKFNSEQDMTHALAAELSQHQTGWTLQFGYITLIPKRMYFDVAFTQDGYVKAVSDVRWGLLD